MEAVKVTITVEVGDDRREFSATANVAGDGVNVASGMVYSLKDDACEWLHASRRRRREQSKAEVEDGFPKGTWRRAIPGRLR